MAKAVRSLPELADKVRVFRDRTHAGAVLAGMLEDYRDSTAVVLAIPSGGVPVAAEIARRLALELDVAVVSKILFPWTTEAGFGAVAFDGSRWIDDDAARIHAIGPDQIERQTKEARAKVERRLKRLRGSRPPLNLAGRTLILVDDGIAAGSTMRAAIAALRKQGAGEIAVAVPTAHDRSLALVAPLADLVVCANIRGGCRFAVADAYEEWRDLGEDEVAGLLHGN